MYLQQYILNDDQGIISKNAKSYSEWGIVSLNGDSYSNGKKRDFRGRSPLGRSVSLSKENRKASAAPCRWLIGGNG